MPRPLWNGSISFGLVNVPVKLFKAQDPKDVRFHQLHAKDGGRIQQKRFCSVEEIEVPYDEIAKGYEVESDSYVMIEADELSGLDPKASHTIDIEDFVDLDQIDPLYFDHGYYVIPGERAEKAYALLVRAMEDSRKVGIAKFVMRTKEYLCAVRPREGALVLETMLFADEVVNADEYAFGDVDEPTARELTMAKQLIDSLSVDFEPTKYKDEYREKVIELIEAKAAGNEIVTRPEAEETAPVVDLMAALEASLAKAKETKRSKASDEEAAEDAHARKPRKRAAG